MVCRIARVWGHGFAAEVIDETYPRVGMALFVYTNLICVKLAVRS